MIAVRSFPDELSTSPILRPKRWEWLEAALQRSNLTSSNKLAEAGSNDLKGHFESIAPVYDVSMADTAALRFRVLVSTADQWDNRLSGLDDHNKSAQSRPMRG